MEIIVVAHNIRSTHNVGSILRTSEGFGVSEVWLSGYTPRYGDTELLPHLREKLNHQIAKTALGAEKMVQIYSSDDIITDLSARRKQGWKVLGLENNIEDPRLYQLGDKHLTELLGDKVMLLLGEEVAGIDYSLYDIIDYFAEIPMQGRKESFNVSVATGIALWGIRFGAD